MYKILNIVIVVLALLPWCKAGANAPFAIQVNFRVGSNNIVKEGEDFIVNLFHKFTYRRDGRWDNGLAKREEVEEHQQSERAYVYKCASNQGLTTTNTSILYKDGVTNDLISKYVILPVTSILTNTSGSCYTYNATLDSNVTLPNTFDGLNPSGTTDTTIDLTLTYGVFASKQWYYRYTSNLYVTIENVAPTLDCQQTTVTKQSGNNYLFQLRASDPVGVVDAPFFATIDWGDNTAQGTINDAYRSQINSKEFSMQSTLSHTYTGNNYQVSITVTDKDGGVSNQCTVTFGSGSGSVTTATPVTTGVTTAVPKTTGVTTSTPVTTGVTTSTPVTTGVTTAVPKTTGVTTATPVTTGVTTAVPKTTGVTTATPVTTGVTTAVPKTTGVTTATPVTTGLTTATPVTTATQQTQPVTTASGNQPVTTATQPVTTADQPVTTGNQPVTTADQPITTADQPVTTGDQPVTTETPPPPVEATTGIIIVDVTTQSVAPSEETTSQSNDITTSSDESSIPLTTSELIITTFNINGTDHQQVSSSSIVRFSSVIMVIIISIYFI